MTLYTSYTPSYDCKTDGNGKGILRLNAGLVTIDEYLKSGGIFYKSGDTLNSYLTPSTFNNRYWTMSPAGFTDYNTYAYAWAVDNASAHAGVCLRRPPFCAPSHFSEG